METTLDRAEEFAGTVRDYINTRIESVKLSAAEKSSAIIGNTVAGVIAALVFCFFLVFGGIALSFVLGDWTGKLWLGFLIVAGLYLVISIGVWAMREKLIRLPIVNAMIRQLFKSDEKDH